MRRTEAWRSLGTVPRALYVELKARFKGKNNGRIGYSIREASDELHIGKTSAAEAFKLLEGRGFIAWVTVGTFDKKIRHSTEWRLTELMDNVTGSLATKEFVHWVPGKDFSKIKPGREKTRYPRTNRSVPHSGPIGISQRTAAA
jgi:hypothetical protein